MKKMHVGVFAILSLLLASVANAQLTGSVGYTHVDEDVSVGALQGTFGFRLPVLEGAAGTGFLIPELRAGVGINDDTVAGVKFEIDNYYGIAPRFQYEADGGVYGFVQTSYVNYKVKGSQMGISVSDSSWEFGAGLGVGMIFTDVLGAELSWERVDSADVFNLSLRFGF
jgi:hypothetical protein